VIAFYYDHGIEYQFDPDFATMKRVLELVQRHEQELVSTDPPRVRVTVRYEGDVLDITLDGEMSVVAAEGGD